MHPKPSNSTTNSTDHGNTTDHGRHSIDDSSNTNPLPSDDTVVIVKPEPVPVDDATCSVYAAADCVAPSIKAKCPVLCGN